VFFVAHSRCPLRQGGIIKGTDANEDREGTANITERPNCPSKAYVSDTEGKQTNGIFKLRPQTDFRTDCDGDKEWSGLQRAGIGSTQSGLGMLADGLSSFLGDYIRVEPNIPRVASGVKNRVQQLKCYGNAVVPQQAYPIFKAIAEIEAGTV